VALLLLVRSEASRETQATPVFVIQPACITPSTETFVVVVSFMVAGPFSDGLCCDR
jgi:hypothetical protein